MNPCCIFAKVVWIIYLKNWYLPMKYLLRYFSMLPFHSWKNQKCFFNCLFQLVFAQIYWLIHGYGWYKLKGGVLNVPTNVQCTQSILPQFPNEETIIGIYIYIYIKNLEYVSPYLSSNVEPNVEMMALQNLTNDSSLPKKIWILTLNLNRSRFI
jgi:hypothetical protein